MTIGHQQRGPALTLGLGGQQISKPFRFIEINPPIFESAAGELSGLRLAQRKAARATLLPQRGLHRTHDRLSAMAMPFDQILTGHAARRRKENHQRPVQYVAIGRVDQRAQMSVARFAPFYPTGK